jgi:hypothetical protein
MLSRAAVRCMTARLLAVPVTLLMGVLCGLSYAQEAPLKSSTPAAMVEVTDVFFPESIGKNLAAHGGWLPVYVELEPKSGEPQLVTIEASMTLREREKPFQVRQSVEVAPGARRRVWTYVRAGPGDDVQTARIAIRDSRGELLRRDEWQVSAFPWSGGRLSLLVVWQSTGGDDTPWPGDLSATGSQLNNFQEFVQSCDARQLPDRVIGYHTMDVVVLRDLGTDKLEPRQLQALRAWVYLGGYVVIVPSGRSPEIFRSEIARTLLGDLLADPKAEDGFVPGSLAFVEEGRPGRLEAKEDDEDISVGGDRAYTLLDPLSGRVAREIRAFPEGIAPAESSGEGTPDAGAFDEALVDDPAWDESVEARRLYAEVPYGRGRVGVFTFDDQTYRDLKTQNFLRAVWRKVVLMRLGLQTSNFTEQAAQFQDAPIEAELKDTSREIGLPVIAGLISCYLLLVGPGLYFLLRRFRRLPSVIWAEPLLVVVYLGVIFTTGYITKGVLTKTRLLTFLSHREGDPLALRESYLSIFSAAEEVYKITAPRGDLLQPVYKNEAEQRPVKLERKAEGELLLDGYELAHWQEGHVVNVEVVDFAPTGVELKETQDFEGTVRLTISNKLPYDILKGIYYFSTDAYAVPKIPLGKTVEIVLEEPLKEDALSERLNIPAKGFGYRGFPRFAAVVAREDTDFQIDRRFSLRERVDYYLLYSK